MPDLVGTGLLRKPTQSRFERWGVNSLVIAKFIPGLSTIAPPMAGAMRIGWLRFILLSTLAAMLWVGSALIGGALFRAQIEMLLARMNRIGGVMLAGRTAAVRLVFGLQVVGAHPFLQVFADVTNQRRGAA